MILFSVWMILFPVLKMIFDLLGEIEKHFVKKKILDQRRGSRRFNSISCCKDLFENPG